MKSIAHVGWMVLGAWIALQQASCRLNVEVAREDNMPDAPPGQVGRDADRGRPDDAGAPDGN